MAVVQAIRDLKMGQFELGKIQKVGLQNAQAVRLTMAADVPNSVRQQIAKVSEDIQTGKIKIPEAYTGPEFATPPII
jgi:basic membrane protein A